MNCAECDKEIEGKAVRFRNQFFDINCAEVLAEDLETAISKFHAEVEDEAEEVVLQEDEG